MSTFNNNITIAENNVQKMLSVLACSQMKATEANARVNTTVNENVGKKIDTFEENQKKYNIYKVIATVFTTISIVLSVLTLGLGILGTGGFIAAGLSMTMGGASFMGGGFKIATGTYQYKIANDNAAINGGMTAERYTSNRTGDLSSKSKDTMQALARLTKTFNQLIMRYSQAMQKRV